MKLTWCGLPLNGRQVATSAFKVMFILYAVYIFVVNIILGPVIRNNEADTHDEDGNEIPDAEDDEGWVRGLKVVRGTIIFVFFLFILLVTIRARGYIRRKYSIPEQSCPGCEDCCCSFWCSTCTICQMLRHTADYQKYQAGCCTETGLANGAPEVVTETGLANSVPEVV
jgi:Cys-rich protein (TIGR01571 family)